MLRSMEHKGLQLSAESASTDIHASDCIFKCTHVVLIIAKGVGGAQFGEKASPVGQSL